MLSEHIRITTPFPDDYSNFSTSTYDSNFFWEPSASTILFCLSFRPRPTIRCLCMYLRSFLSTGLVSQIRVSSAEAARKQIMSQWTIAHDSQPMSSSSQSWCSCDFCILNCLQVSNCICPRSRKVLA